MTYLLDANVLIALAVDQHIHHDRVVRWYKQNKNFDVDFAIATTAITELALVRVLERHPDCQMPVDMSLFFLKNLRERSRFVFLVDDHPASRLPAWVSKASQTTDVHLRELAGANGARFATLDRKIPDTYLLPE